MEDAVNELRARGFPPGGKIGGRSKAPRQQQVDMLGKEGDRASGFCCKGFIIVVVVLFDKDVRDIH